MWYRGGMSDQAVAVRIGAPVLGPMADDETPELLDQDIQTLADGLRTDFGSFVVEVPTGALDGLLRAFNARARIVLTALLHGYSVGMAAANVGVDPDTVARWAKREPEFGVALKKARDWGFRRTAERELQRRAMAGPDDRASGRLLELWLKREDAAYRDKSQLDIAVHQAFEAAGTSAIAGWHTEAIDTNRSVAGELAEPADPATGGG